MLDVMAVEAWIDKGSVARASPTTDMTVCDRALQAVYIDASLQAHIKSSIAQCSHFNDYNKLERWSRKSCQKKIRKSRITIIGATDDCSKTDEYDVHSECESRQIFYGTPFLHRVPKRRSWSLDHV